MTEENLDTALAKVCTNFDTQTYSKIQVFFIDSLV